MLKNVIERARSMLMRRKTAYKGTFESEYGKIVLQDLAIFCRGTTTTFDKDDRVHALLEGRREVLMRIAQHMNLSFEDLWVMYDGRIEKNDRK